MSTRKNMAVRFLSHLLSLVLFMVASIFGISGFLIVIDRRILLLCSVILYGISVFLFMVTEILTIKQFTSSQKTEVSK